MKCSDILGWCQVALYLLCCKCLCFRCCFKKHDSPTQQRHRINLKVLLLGLPKSGKSSFVTNFLKLTQQEHKSLQSNISSQPFPPNDHTAYTPTAGCLVHKEAWIRDFKLTLTEVGGKFTKYWNKYTKGNHGLIYLVHGDIKTSIDALESFVVGNHEVRDWPLCILSSYADDDSAGDYLKELELYIRKRHMLNAWNTNTYVARIGSYSSPNYSAAVAEKEFRKAIDFVCVGATTFRMKQVTQSKSV